jgi:hypothetical protein
MEAHKTYKELKTLSIEQLEEIYDLHAKNTVVGLGFFREEIARREAEKASQQMTYLTEQMRDLTKYIYRLTIANLVFVALSILVSLFTLFR